MYFHSSVSFSVNSRLIITNMAERPSQNVGQESQSMEPALGMFYHVQRVDESWHVAEVIQKRENVVTKEHEFYVHYKECKS